MTNQAKTVKWENVYIFISSTFDDMHAERDYLVKQVFPELNEWCESRKLHMVDIDLRWGVTEADVTQNKNAVNVCLDRIDYCRPFFLCFLGQRYGWIPQYPEDISEETVKTYPGLKDAITKGASVTELEILHSVLSPFLSPETIKEEGYHPSKYAYFYLRDDSYLKDLPDKPSYLRSIYSDTEKEDEQEREKLSQKRNELIEKIECKKIYHSSWFEASATPEITVPLQCPATLEENQDRWRSDWLKHAGVFIKGLDVEEDPSQAKKARDFNDELTRGRLVEFKCGGEDLVDVVLRDLMQAIEERFPDHKEVEAEDELQKEIDQQSQFVFTGSEGFIERTGDFDQLDEYVEGDSRKLFVLTAGAGMGKSTLLAKWVGNYRERIQGKPGHSVHFRFVGTSDGSTTIHSLLRLLLREIKEVGGKLDDEIPGDSKKLRSALPELLYKIGQKGKTVIVIDALNQLETGLSDLTWLPRHLPQNIKLVVSFKRGEEAAEELYSNLAGDQRVQLAEVKPFEDRKDRYQLVEAYLKRYLKELDERHIDALIDSPSANNPLYLKVVLPELRVFGVFATVGEKIRTDFGETPESAFGGVLRRLECDPAYSLIDPSEAVPLIFGLLAHARHGLSADELVSLFIQALDKEDNDKNRKDASDTVYLFFRQVRPFLARRGGRYDFFYQSFKNAALQRYVSEEPKPPRRMSQSWHRLLAHYFDISAGIGERKLNEYPYQLQHAEEYQGLATALSDLDFFEYAFARNREYEWMGYWRFLQGRSEPGECYRAAIEAREKIEGETRNIAQLLNKIGIFLREMGLYSSASPFTQRALAIMEKARGPNHPDVAISLNNLAMLYHRQGKYDEALPLYQRALAIWEKALGPDHPDMATSLNNLAALYRGQGKYDEALPLYQRALAIREKTLGPDHPDVATSLNNLAELYRAQGKYDEALPLYQRALALDKRALGPDHPDVATSLNNLAALYHRQGKYDEALPLYQRALAIKEKALGSDHPDVAQGFNNLATLYYKQGKYDEALRLFKRAVSIAEASLDPEHRDTMVFRGNLKACEEAMR